MLGRRRHPQDERPQDEQARTHRPQGDRPGFLMRLLGDTRGNALAIMAAGLVPLAGMVGGGIDISRMYILKTRLQHACDAGALAGRKAMGAGTWAYNNNYAQAQAQQFFDGNFADGSYGSSNLSRTFSENAGKVSGVAAATIPMTLMRIFGKPAQTLSVTCDAEMRLPNTDVMFVLDTTGSMGDIPAGDTTTKIDSLKVAVKCFYEIVARLDTNATCTTGTPSGGTGSQVQVRFGFVPYATNVNVGKLLKPGWFVDSADYQTRKAVFEDVTTTSDPVVTGTEYNNLNPQNNWANSQDLGSSSRTWCNNQTVPGDSAFTGIYSEGSPVEYRTTGTNPSTTTWATYQYGYFYTYRRNYSNGRCYIQRSTTYADLKRKYSKTSTTTPTFSRWRYAKMPVNVGLLKNGESWNNSFQWQIGPQGTDATINWDGCVEERQTTSQASYIPIPAGAKDLDIDSTPVPGDATTQWRPVLGDMRFTRYDSNGFTQNTVETADDLYKGYYACPQEARKLQSWPDATAFSSYVDGLYAEGNTYHDIGLIWGARLLSPTGIFASENATTPSGGSIERHMIFMTDGDACTGIDNYTAYGINWFDRRTTGAASAPTDGCTNTGTLTRQVNARTDALCTAIKNKNITLWVITFGKVDASTVTRLTACATSGKYFSANNAAQLQTTFKSIADQISMLRLTR